MLKKIIKYISIYLAIIIFFIVSLVAVSSFKKEFLTENVKKSAEVLLSEGNRKVIYIPYKDMDMQFDNYTDALMINTAYSIDSQKPLYSAFVARKNYIPNITTEIYEDVPGELKSSSKYSRHNEVGELNDLVNNEKAESFEYARYWQGYLIFLRPLLILFNINQIRIMLTIILIILACILAYFIYKKINILISIIFLTSLLGVEYFYLGFSMQGVFIFLITMISSTILVERYEKIKDFGMLFFIIGMLTNFFDFLTVPMITYAIPLTLYFLLKRRENNELNAKKIIIDIIKYGALWGIGYGATWFTKWALTDILFGKNIISTALMQVSYRSNGYKTYNVLKVIGRNMIYIISQLLVNVIITILLAKLYEIIKMKKVEKISITNKEIFIAILPYILISIMPFIWYALLQNHSYYHAFFTYRNLILTSLGICLCLEETLTLQFKTKGDIEK